MQGGHGKGRRHEGGLQFAGQGCFSSVTLKYHFADHFGDSIGPMDGTRWIALVDLAGLKVH